MSFKIIVDSCCDLTAAHFLEGPFIRVPLTISLGGEDIVDNDTFDQTHLLLLMRENEEPPKTACPSPAQYMDAFEAAGDSDIYVVTLSALLSGSHNAAAQARAIWLEDHPDAHIHIFNSCSAAAGEVLVALKLRELALASPDFQTVVQECSRYIASMTTMFVLEDLDHLRKNGRLTGALALVTEALRIKLLMGATPEGEIKKISQALSIKQALSRMVNLMAQDPNHAGKELSIVHCNNRKRAFYVRDLVQKTCNFKDILITDARGVTTVYANDGGVVVAY
ncbi:MAG: DegV family protein [Oscillospiraceae bacterium]|nr:DegV family protein [Oscillospiraceae bacterium]